MQCSVMTLSSDHSIPYRRTWQRMLRLSFILLCLLFMMNISSVLKDNISQPSHRILNPVDIINQNTTINDEQNGGSPNSTETSSTDHNKENDTNRLPSFENACRRAENYATFPTRNNYVVSFIFELETTSDPILESRSIQSRIIRHLLQVLMLESGLCNDYIKSWSNRKLVVTLDGLWGVGSPSHPTILSTTCAGSSTSKSCFRMMASVVVYFDESMTVINYTEVKETILSLIYENKIELGPNKVTFQPEDENVVKEQDTNSTLSGEIAPVSEIPARNAVELTWILFTMAGVVIITVGVIYCVLQKYFVVVRRPVYVNEKGPNVPCEVSSIAFTQKMSPTSSNDEYVEKIREKDTVSNLTMWHGSLGIDTFHDEFSSDAEQSSSLHDIRLDSKRHDTKEIYPQMVTLGHDSFDTKDRQRKAYIKRQRQLNRLNRKSPHQEFVSNTVDL